MAYRQGVLQGQGGKPRGRVSAYSRRRMQAGIHGAAWLRREWAGIDRAAFWGVKVGR